MSEYKPPILMRLSFCFFLSLSLIVISCKPTFQEPQISLEDYKVEEGFELEMVASEPLLTAPVAIDFDSKGRIWVAEMAGFMLNLEGDGEDSPSGAIKILEDHDNDGIMEITNKLLPYLKESGFFPFIDLLIASLPKAYHESVFAMSIDLAMSNGEITVEEEKILNYLWDKFPIDDEIGKQIYNSLQIKNQI